MIFKKKKNKVDKPEIGNQIFNDIIALDTFKTNEIKKLQKVINLMAEDRAEISEPKVSKEAIIDFYYKKVEEEND